MKRKFTFIIIGLSSFLLYGFLIFVDAFEIIAEWLQKYEAYELDELLLLLPVYAFGLSIYALIKQKELKETTQQLRHEITHRKFAENKQKDSRHLLLTHLENTPVPAVFWDLKFRITVWNPAAERVFGYKKGDVLGKNLMKLIFHGESKELGKKILHDLNLSKDGVQSVVINITKDGETVPCHWYSTLLRNRRDTVVGVASLVFRLPDSSFSM